jgi:hypothetical protein
MEVLEKRQKILDILSEVEQELEKHPETIPEHVFQTLEGFCKLVYTWKHSPEKTGWTTKLSQFSPSESKVIESRFQDFNSQVGGGPEEDKQFSKLFADFQKILGDVGTQWREITTSLGIIATNEIKKILPNEIPSLEEVQKKKGAQQNASELIFTFISAMVETLRIWVAYSFIDSTTYRIFLSFSQALLDTVRGNVRQAIFSSLGLFGKGGFYISILTRFVLNVIETITPQLREQLEFDVYRNMKSLTAGGLLWGYYTFAPFTLKYNINQVFKEIQEIAKKEDISLTPFTKQIKKSAKNEEFTLPDMPIETMPTYDDLQTLGTLLREQDIACQPTFKKLIKPLRSVFTLRLILDLFDIPTGDVEIDDLCARERSITRKNMGQKGGTVRRKRTRRN